MDWIDDKLNQLKSKIKKLSIRKALCFYIVVFCIIVVVLSAVTIGIVTRWDNLIWGKYTVHDSEWSNSNPRVVYYEDYTVLTRSERIFVEIIDFVQSWCIIFYSLIGIFAASYFFYRNKLKEPLRILTEGSDKIRKNELDFDLKYDAMDEMGELCNSFELMRLELIANNTKMWELMEEQKRLKAAFAHDLRTPLTVLHGYTDFLVKYVPQGELSQEKIMSTLTLLSSHIQRLEIYANTMKDIHSLEELQLNPKPTNARSMEEKLREIIHVMDGSNHISVILTEKLHQGMRLYLDEYVVIEVFENMLSNAIRYARSKVEITLEEDRNEKKLLIHVYDDGRGFSSEEKKMALKPYYRDTTDKEPSHYGIGLYICKMLCEKHGGNISLSNSIHQGAIVTATFLSQESEM